MTEIRTWFPRPFADHALVDSGAGERLERFGTRLLRRPDPRALWGRRLGRERWDDADLTFERDPGSGGQRGRWLERSGREVREASWTLRWRDVACVVRPTAFKHVGVFPEQAANWELLARVLPALERPRVLNLFGYSGVASLVALAAGAEVTHVDASRPSLAWVSENRAASGLPERGLRLILDDAAAFARREVRRGSRYEVIVVDPPHHGRGPKGQAWQLEEHLDPLLATLADLVAERALVIVSTYAVTTSPLGLAGLCARFPRDHGGELEVGELALVEEGADGRALPCGFGARWSRGLEVHA